MSLTNQKRKLVGYSIVSIAFSLLLAVGIIHGQTTTRLFGDNTQPYSINLNSGNKVTSNGDHVMKTGLNNNVTFTYSNVSGSTSGHVTLNSNGTINNKDHIRGIKSITATFDAENSLTFKTSFDNATWGGSTSMVSGYKYNLGSDPYHVYFQASKSVTITSLQIEFSCVVNPNAHEGEELGAGLLGVIDFWNVANKDNTSNNTNVNAEYVTDRSFDTDDTSTREAKTLVSSVTANCTYQNRYGGIGLSSSKNAASFTLTLANEIEPYSVTVIAGTRNPSKSLSLNSSSKSVTKNCTGITELNSTYTDTLEWTFESAPSSLTFTCASSSTIAIYRIYLYGESGATIEAPEESIIGFTATDSKATSYYQDEIYDTANGLSVYANKTGGTNVQLSKGGEDGYSYVIKNSSNVSIDTSKAFGEDGTYTLIVSYKDFIPVEIQLTVGFRLAITEITVNSTTLTFNTAQKLSDFTNGITVDLVYNRPSENENGVAYSDFASKGLTMSLLNPSDVVTDITSLFGTTGTWKIKVESNNDSSVYGLLNITVNAVLVETITVTGSSSTLEVGGQLQLTVNVLPATATNKEITWSTNHQNIATVTSTGLVTAVAVGEVRITATAKDGSQIYGYIDLTVIASSVSNYEDVTMAGGTNSFAATINGNDGYKMGTSKATGSMTITVPEKATKLKFYAAGWNGTSCTVTLTSSPSITISNTSLSLTADSGIAGSGSTFTLNGEESDYLFELTLSNVTSQTTITLSGSARFVVWGAQAKHSIEAPVYPETITLTANSSSIGIGGTLQLTVNYSPNNTNVKKVSFVSSATNIATVSEDGLITGVAAGNATITATAEGENSTDVTATFNVSVTSIAVTGVSLNKTSISLQVNDTETLVPTIIPANATNKNVTWSTSDSTVATVSNGTVTAKKAGSATITVRTVDGNKAATCDVTVTAGSSIAVGELITSNSSLSDGDTVFIKTTTGTGVTGLGSGNAAVSTTEANWKAYVVVDATSSGFKLYDADAEQYIATPTSNTFAYSSNGGTCSVDESGHLMCNNRYLCANGTYYRFYSGIGSYTPFFVYMAGSSTPTDPTSIAVNPSTVSLARSGTKDLTVTYTPSGANQNKEVTWSSNNTSVATVDTNGRVTVKSTATIGATATITATLTNLSSISATCVVTVVEQQNDDQTILIYMCGSDLESDGQEKSSKASGYATSDISEILSVAGQPTGTGKVNVVIETGGAKCWKSTYGISANYLTRYHVSNKSLVQDSQETKADMALSATLQSFVTWGLQNYPADRVSLILWNHGGAMRGVCYDENYEHSGIGALTNDRVKTAIGNSFNTLGRSASDKLEWIGYDACLMSVQDIAEFNSQYFKYMVASEESEAGSGWDYDTWIDNAYAKDSTENILTAIVNGFISATNTLYSQNNWGASDQTLSWCDLSYMSAYKSAWETMSSTINSLISSYGKSNFQTLMKTVKSYGDTVYGYSDLQSIASDNDCTVNDVIQSLALEQVGSDYYDYGYYYYGIFDAKDFLNKIKNTSAFSSASSQINAAISAFGDLVKYSQKGSGAGNSNGLCCFFPLNNGTSYTCQKSTYYSTSMTNFTNWRSIVNSYGG